MRAAGEAIFGAETPICLKNRRSVHQNARSAMPPSRALERPILGRRRRLLPRARPAAWLLLPLCQRHCCRALRSHDGSVAARELVRRVGQGVRRTSRRLARDARRVSAAFRRGAAAYGVASRPLEEARTHGSLPTKGALLAELAADMARFCVRQGTIVVSPVSPRY